MIDLFNFHAEGSIGIKSLTIADLGLGESHQTHIGLYNEVLTFLPDHAYAEKGLLIHDIDYEFVEVYFDRITNPDGTTRSPKFRLGIEPASLTARIREIVKLSQNAKWYLIWFAVESNRVVSLLLNEQDLLANDLKDLGVSLDKAVILSHTPLYSKVANLIQMYIFKVVKDTVYTIEYKIGLRELLTRDEYYFVDILLIFSRISKIYQIATESLKAFFQSKIINNQISSFEIQPNDASMFSSRFCTIIKGESKKTALLKVTESDSPLPFIINIIDIGQGISPYHENWGLIWVFNIDEKGCSIKSCSSIKALIKKNCELNSLDPNLFDHTSSTIHNIQVEIKPSVLSSEFKKTIRISMID